MDSMCYTKCCFTHISRTAQLIHCKLGGCISEDPREGGVECKVDCRSVSPQHGKQHFLEPIVFVYSVRRALLLIRCSPLKRCETLSFFAVRNTSIFSSGLMFEAMRGWLWRNTGLCLLPERRRNLSIETAAHFQPCRRTNAPNAPNTTDTPITSPPASHRESISHTCRGYSGKIEAGEGSVAEVYPGASGLEVCVCVLVSEECREGDEGQKEETLSGRFTHKCVFHPKCTVGSSFSLVCRKVERQSAVMNERYKVKLRAFGTEPEFGNGLVALWVKVCEGGREGGEKEWIKGLVTLMNSGTYGFAITREFTLRAPWFFSHISTKRERAEVGATGGNFPLNTIKPFKNIIKRFTGLLGACRYRSVKPNTAEFSTFSPTAEDLRLVRE
ncbi:hypothetical protein F7725_010985, partial [Dissostichus mawsoni]